MAPVVSFHQFFLGVINMKKYLEIGLVAIVAVAIGKQVPVIKNYL